MQTILSRLKAKKSYYKVRFYQGTEDMIVSQSRIYTEKFLTEKQIKQELKRSGHKCHSIAWISGLIEEE
jgi:hypothetical protein